MKQRYLARRASVLACGLAGLLAATACGDDTAVDDMPGTLDAGGTTPDATTDAGSPGVDAGRDSSVDAGSPAAEAGADSSVDAGAVVDSSVDTGVEASAHDGGVEASAADGGIEASAHDGGVEASTPDGSVASDAGDAGNPDGGDAANSEGGAVCTGTPSANLIVNGDAESGTGSTDATPVATPGWTSTGEATALQYGSGAYPALTDPGPTDRGVNLFIGGQNDATSSLTQTVDLSSDAASIDAEAVTYALSGWLGGYSTQEDYATLTVTFRDGTGTAIGAGTIGPVTAEDRAGVTGLLERSTTGAVPSGTRSVLVELDMVREEGTANDGYADNLSLTLCGL